MMEKPFSQAAENNKQVILEHLSDLFAASRRVFEVGSGTGQHAAFFAQALSHLEWQTSDLEHHLPGIVQWLKEANNYAIPPIVFDLSNPKWPSDFDAVYTANTLHVLEWPLVLRFLSGAAYHLPEGGKMVIYGPFKYQGKFTSQSNADFDIWLKNQYTSHSGIRDFEAVSEVLSEGGMTLIKDFAMPANNQLLAWRKC